MHPVIIGIGLIVATIALAFLPQAVWPEWPARWVMVWGMLAILLFGLIDGLRSGVFGTNYGHLDREKTPAKYWKHVAMIVVGILVIAGLLVGLHPFGDT
jgi:hypothetical protein